MGSQILAEVLGGKVYPHDKKEIGFFPIYKTEATMQEAALALMPASWTVFHWHGDTFDLPPGAVTRQVLMIFVAEFLDGASKRFTATLRVPIAGRREVLAGSFCLARG